MTFSPERFRDLRIITRYTTDALALELQVTKQSVSNYETGKAIPSATVLNRFASFYSLPRGYLTKENIMPERQSAIFYRKLARTPQREMDEARVTLKWLYEIVQAVASFFAIEQVDLPTFPAEASIEEKALLLRRHWKLGEEPVENLFQVLEKHGIYTWTLDLYNDEIDGYSQYIGCHPIIVINENRGDLARRQFSMAHELGHLVLHSKEEALDQETMEREANQFAGCFLMPERSIRSELLRRDVEYFVSLARRWRVSPEALVKRCEMLSLFDSDKVKNRTRATALYQRLRRIERHRNISGTDAKQTGICTIIREIEASEEMCAEFLRILCFPISQIQRLCGMPNIFRQYANGVAFSTDDIGGVQLSFIQ